MNSIEQLIRKKLTVSLEEKKKEIAGPLIVDEATTSLGMAGVPNATAKPKNPMAIQKKRQNIQQQMQKIQQQMVALQQQRSDLVTKMSQIRTESTQINETESLEQLHLVANHHGFKAQEPKNRRSGDNTIYYRHPNGASMTADNNGWAYHQDDFHHRGKTARELDRNLYAWHKNNYYPPAASPYFGKDD